MAMLTASRFVLIVMLASAPIAGCSSSGPGSTPTPSPLSLAEMRARYLAAASVYNAGEARLPALENMYCDPHSSSAALMPCQVAIGQDRQLTIAFDNALRAVNFSGQVKTDIAKLLSDDAALENLLREEAAAANLSVVAQLTNQTFPVYNQAAGDANKVRADLGLPSPSA